MKRETYVLTTIERNEYIRLRGVIGEARQFWCKVAKRLNVDVTTILTESVSSGYVRFTALPIGHGKHWCWPYKLKCTTDPSTVEY